MSVTWSGSRPLAAISSLERRVSPASSMLRLVRGCRSLWQTLGPSGIYTDREEGWRKQRKAHVVRSESNSNEFWQKQEVPLEANRSLPPSIGYIWATEPQNHFKWQFLTVFGIFWHTIKGSSKTNKTFRSSKKQIGLVIFQQYISTNQRPAVYLVVLVFHWSHLCIKSYEWIKFASDHMCKRAFTRYLITVSTL